MENSAEQCKEEKQLKTVPKAVPIILSNILLERYSTTGTSGKVNIIIFLTNKSSINLLIAGILALYLHRKLNFDPSTSTAIFHTNELLAYAFTIIGAIIADSWLGLFKTILWMSLVFAVGGAVVAIGSIELLNLPTL